MCHSRWREESREDLNTKDGNEKNNNLLVIELNIFQKKCKFNWI
jgi:hypothetical protein